MTNTLSVARAATLLPLLLLAASCATVPDQEGTDPKLTEALVGKVAGKPQMCIPLDDARSGEVYRGAILYRTSRKLNYVSVSPGCSTFTRDPIFVNKLYSNRLCRGDIVEFVDRTGGIPGPSCVLGDFTPYRTPR